jgi:hypothetical protein
MLQPAGLEEGLTKGTTLIQAVEAGAIFLIVTSI